ncbi:MAG: DNA repair protein RecO [Chitinispirillaceae bacterium]|jgi:DNA repair protein RecO (recombination protein O)|nr:DNA repair protein RecO [Chitinispirillaceae bacterium]
MGIEKNQCVVLSVMPYRESSVIVSLLSRTHGRVSGIAKGVRRKPTDPLTFERGFMVETVLYVKPNRDLHTIGASSVTGCFPVIRSDLGKIAIRDVALEVVLRSTPVPDAHPELYDFVAAFLARLECAPAQPLPLDEIWGFFHGWSALLGFRLVLHECVQCGKIRTPDRNAYFDAQQGGIVCSVCAGDRTSQPVFLSGKVIEHLISADEGRGRPIIGKIPPAEQMRITRLLADFCRLHLDIRQELKTLEFIESLFV